MNYLLQFGGLSVRDVSTSSTRTAVSHNQFLQIHPASYKFSADRSLLVLVTLFYLHLCDTRKYLLVKTSNQRVWRRSSFGDYGLLRMAQDGRPASSTVTNLLLSNRNNREHVLSQVISLSPPNTGGDLEASTAQYIRLVTWAPTGNAIAYVDYNNNIHYR